MQSKGLYKFLDEALGAIPEPTHQQIQNAKKQYRELYLKAYQKKRRQRIKEYTLGFDGNHMQRIHKQRGTQSVSEFLYQCVRGTLDTGIGISDGKLLGEIHALQLEIIEALEDISEHSDSYIMEVFLEKMETLEAYIVQLRGL